MSCKNSLDKHVSICSSLQQIATTVPLADQRVGVEGGAAPMGLRAAYVWKFHWNIMQLIKSTHIRDFWLEEDYTHDVDLLRQSTGCACS
jgi:hypothetical protein